MRYRAKAKVLNLLEMPVYSSHLTEVAAIGISKCINVIIKRQYLTPSMASTNIQDCPPGYVEPRYISTPHAGHTVHSEVEICSFLITGHGGILNDTEAALQVLKNGLTATQRCRRSLHTEMCFLHE